MFLSLKWVILHLLLAALTDFTGRGVTRAQDFGYDGDTGPNHWGEQFNTCFGKHQSPINIDPLYVKKVTLPPLKFTGFDEEHETNITNNGHTVLLQVSSGEAPTVSGGPLDGEYSFLQLHFHWGDNDTFGSEDLIDSQSFPMELHMVFYKKSYRNARSAMNHSDGLTVLAFFYKIEDKDNEAYMELTTLLDYVTQPQTTIELQKPYTLRDLITDDQMHYYSYNGSLTTPPCSEIVTWIDFQKPIMLSHDQIEAFRALQSEHGKLTHNFRPIQPLGDRTVLYNTEMLPETNDIDESNEIVKEVDMESKSHRKSKKSSATVSSISYLIIPLASFILALR